MFETLIINPLIAILEIFYSLFGNNIVLAIIALTVIIRLITLPLFIRQQQATDKIKELQPKLKQLQEIYKNDRENLAMEQLELYKEAGMNPLSGCLPILIQLPIMIALYQAIAMVLAKTPSQWAGIDLLLTPTMNPIYALIFPLAVGITTWLQTKLIMPMSEPSGNTKTGRTIKITQSIATIMPILFMFFSLSFSVGLSIYFVAFNVVGIILYTLIGKADWQGLFRKRRVKL